MIKNELLNKNCMDILPDIPDRSIDLICSDPPYAEIVHSYAKSFNKRTKTITELLTTFGHWGYTDMFCVLGHFARIARRWIILTVAYDQIFPIQSACNDKVILLDFVRFGIWDKLDSGIPQLTGDRPAPGWEAIAMLHVPGKKEWNANHKTSMYRFRGMIGGGLHPTQKPVELIRQFLLDFSNEGDIVLDPFMGSGTVPYVCKELNRNYIGIEQDPTYFEVAKNRINQSLF